MTIFDRFIIYKDVSPGKPMLNPAKVEPTPTVSVEDP
jgi:hypothetical protein